MQKVMAAGWLRTKEDMVVEEWAPAVWGQPPTLEEPVQQPTVAPSNQTASNVTYSQRWPEARVAAVESLWGAGYVSPGGPDETLRLTKPLGLDANSTLIVLGGGIGGPALTVTSSFKSWVTSLEADPVLAAVAEARRPSLDTSKRITMQGWQRDRPAFKPRSANHALSLEAMRGVPPVPVIKGLAGAMRPQGHIVMTELVADKPTPEGDREFGAWCRLEDRLPVLPRTADISTALEREKFDVRVVEDISERHVTQTLEGWRAAVKAMTVGARPAAAAAAAFVNEAELWLLRIRLMKRLELKLIRWYALSH
jgi:cyclopropane fatty-acyl-phospholipid synthase-like methyltransferase